MKSFLERFRAMGACEKVLTVVGLLTSFAIIILAVLFLTGVFEGAAWFYIPLAGVNLLCQGLRFWKSSRSTAIISFVCAGVIGVCFILMFIL